MQNPDLGIPQIIQTYFFSGYTVFNTLVYGIILIIILYGIIKLFEKLDIDPKSIIFSLIPLIILGSTTRALVDNGLLPFNIFLITPGIYFVIGIIGILSLIFSVYLYNKKNLNYKYTIFIIGMILALIPLIKIPYLNIKAISEICLIWIPLTIVMFIIRKFWKLYRDKINLSIISAHLFDASTTVIAVENYGYFEQHVLPNLLYKTFDSALTMFPMKIIVITLSLYLIDRYIDDKTINGLLKLTIFVLGLAPGIRNCISLGIGTFI